MLTTEQIIDCAVDSMYAIAALVRDDVRVVELRAAVFAFARAIEEEVLRRMKEENNGQ